MKKESAMMISLVLIIVIVLASLSLFNMDITGRVISPGFTCGSYSNVIPNIVSSSDSYNSNYPATNAIDNNYNTAWISSFNSGSNWIEFDLARIRCVREIDLGISGYYLPALVNIQASIDGDSWKTVVSDWKLENANDLNRKLFASTEARYVRVVFNNNPAVQGSGTVQGSGSGSAPYTLYSSVSEVRLTIARLTPISGSGASGSGGSGIVPVVRSSGTAVITTTQASCVDSDNGKVIGVAGTATTETGSFVDNCISESILVEHSCTGKENLEDRYSCTQGCSEGICIGGEGTLISDAPLNPPVDDPGNPGGPSSPGGNGGGNGGGNVGSTSVSQGNDNGGNNVADDSGSDNPVVKLDDNVSDNPPRNLNWLWWVLLLLVVLGGIIWYVYKKSGDDNNSSESAVSSKPVPVAPSKPLVSNVKSPLKVKAK
ncbi:hypothetical protein COU54_01630 [Candidatus Pacearchaeota archaeon CG10_big_fil_rev_8_21_14_0_10_31_24]|nr:MAG: hypothetical protein COU54_01630 [Candidatus Pacearchaeota archaeon CG10_big_fil_rev_8_21_14_0_10_31_24]